MSISQSSKQLSQGRMIEISMRDLLEPLFRRRRLLAYVFCGVFFGSLAAIVLLPNQYQAQMKIFVNRKRVDPTVTTQAASQTAAPEPPISEAEINSEVELLQSRDLLEKVVLANHLEEKEKHGLLAFMAPNRSDREYLSSAVERLDKKLKIAAIPKTTLIQVDYRSSDPQLAYGVLNALAGDYMEKHLAVHRPTGSADFFQQEMTKYRGALSQAESDLANFGNQGGVVAPDVQRQFLAQKLVDFVGTLHDANQNIAASEHRITSDLAQLKSIPARSSTLQVSTPATNLLQQLYQNLLDAELKRERLLVKYAPTYPYVVETDQEIAKTKQAIAAAEKQQYVADTTDRDASYELVRQDLAKTQADLAAYRATASAAKESIRQMQAQMVELDAKALKQGDLLREAKANESNYLLYLSKWQEERSSDVLDQRRIANAAISEPPAVPAVPATSKTLLLMIGFVLAIFAAVISVFVAEYLDPSFRTPDEVARVLEMPVLASIPKQVA